MEEVEDEGEEEEEVREGVNSVTCRRITARMVLAEIDSEDEGGREGEGGGEAESSSGGEEKKETR